MRNRRWATSVAAVAALGLALSACGGGDGDTGAGDGESPEDTGGPLSYGYVLPETGTLAFLGPPQIEAAKYAISEINNAGGVLGEDVPEIIGGDEADDQTVASQSATRVLNEGVSAVIGAAASGMSLAIIDQITGAQVVQCSGSNTAPTFTDYEDGGYYFRTAPSDELQGPILANVVVGDGHSNVAIVARADDYGQGLADATAAALEEAGATVALNETYDPRTTNFGSIVNAISSSNADAAVVIAFEEGAQIIKGMVEAGVGPQDIGVYGADGLRSEELGELVSPGNPGVLQGMKGTAPASAENPQFTKALKEFAPDLEALQFAPQVFDCVNIVALAAEQAGTTDPAVFKDEVVAVTKDGEQCSSFEECRDLVQDGEDIDYQGASGGLDFVDVGEPGSATIEVYGYNAQGKLESLRTEKSTPVE